MPPDRHSSLPPMSATSLAVWGLDPETGKPDVERAARAVDGRLCWCSGEKLGRYLSFGLSVTAALTRSSSVPPSRERCLLSVVQGDYPAMPWPDIGVIWTTTDYTFRTVGDGVLFLPGEPTSIQWIAAGGRTPSMTEGYEAINAALVPLVEAVLNAPDRDQSELTATAMLLHRFLPLAPS